MVTRPRPCCIRLARDSGASELSKHRKPQPDQPGTDTDFRRSWNDEAQSRTANDGENRRGRIGGDGYDRGVRRRTTSTTPTSTSTNVGTTITLTANGVSDAAPRISLGQKVRFTNNDSQPHQILTTPHLLHTDCPTLNEVDVVAPGQSGDSGVLNETRGCGFHDHMNPTNNAFRGQVLVGLSASDPMPSSSLRETLTSFSHPPSIAMEGVHESPAGATHLLFSSRAV